MISKIVKHCCKSIDEQLFVKWIKSMSIIKVVLKTFLACCNNLDALQFMLSDLQTRLRLAIFRSPTKKCLKKFKMMEKWSLNYMFRFF